MWCVCVWVFWCVAVSLSWCVCVSAQWHAIGRAVSMLTWLSYILKKGLLNITDGCQCLCSVTSGDTSNTITIITTSTFLQTQPGGALKTQEPSKHEIIRPTESAFTNKMPKWLIYNIFIDTLARRTNIGLLVLDILTVKTRFYHCAISPLKMEEKWLMNLFSPNFSAFTGKIIKSILKAVYFHPCWPVCWIQKRRKSFKSARLLDKSNQHGRETSSTHHHRNFHSSPDGLAATEVTEKVTITMYQQQKDWREALLK